MADGTEQNFERLMGLSEQELRTYASEQNIDGRASMNKEALAHALNDSGFEPAWPLSEDVPQGETQVSGFQEGVAYPMMPTTASEFQRLLPNPNRPAENQSAPSQEQLNPHLFGPQGRL